MNNQNNKPQSHEKSGSDYAPSNKSALKQKRINELLDGCRDQVLQQVIGPFGLNSAMFEDKTGGSVTTQHNAEKKIFAQDSEHYVPKDYSGSAFKKSKSQRINEQTNANGQIIDPTSGKALSVKENGKVKGDGDHFIAAENLHISGAWRKDKAGRNALGGEIDNINVIDPSANRSKGATPHDEWIEKGKTGEQNNKAKFRQDSRRTNALKRKAVSAVKKHETTFEDKVLYDAKAIGATGADAAARNAFKQATGILLFELVNGSFVEISRVAQDPTLQENFLEHLISALRNVAEKVKQRVGDVFKSFVTGGIQGFISNLITYIINNVVTTSAKVVSIIRDGLKGLWEAIKMVANPPVGMSGLEIAREVTKLIAGVVTASIGVIFEKSVEGFILSTPLAPFAGIVAPAVTAILTGVIAALVVFGIDRFFDWLSDSGVEKLNAQIASLEASAEVFERMGQMLQLQFNNSKQYQLCIDQNREISADLTNSAEYSANTLKSSELAITSRNATIETLKNGLLSLKNEDDEVDALLSDYLQNKKH